MFVGAKYSHAGIASATSAAVASTERSRVRVTMAVHLAGKSAVGRAGPKGPCSPHRSDALLRRSLVARGLTGRVDDRQIEGVRDVHRRAGELRAAARATIGEV